MANYCMAVIKSLRGTEANRRQQGQLSGCGGVIQPHLGLLFLGLAGQYLSLLLLLIALLLLCSMSAIGYKLVDMNVCFNFMICTRED